MSTVSRSLPELSPVQRKGLVLTVVGLLIFLSFPVVRLATFTPPSGPQFGFMIISPYGACVLVWGLYVLRTGRERPLTPRRALLIPILVITMFALVDVPTRGELFQFWEYVSRSWAHLHVGSLARYVPFAASMGSSTYVILGAAVRMRKRRAMLAAVIPVLFFVWLTSQNNPLGRTAFALTLIGIIPFVVGYRATEGPENPTTLADILLGLSAPERRGLKLTVVGLLLFAAFPVLRLADVLEWGGGGLWVLLLSTYGACILVWGVYVLRTERRRPLTPKRALLIPLVMVVMTVATDFLTRGRLIEWWIDSRFQGPLNNLDVLGRRFPQLEHIGASIYAVLGAATRSEQWAWVFVSIGLILGVSWLLEIIVWSSWMFVLVAIFGIVPAIIGYRATAPPDR